MKINKASQRIPKMGFCAMVMINCFQYGFVSRLSSDETPMLKSMYSRMHTFIYLKTKKELVGAQRILQKVRQARNILGMTGWRRRHRQGHSAKMSFDSGILHPKFFDCGVSLESKAAKWKPVRAQTKTLRWMIDAITFAQSRMAMNSC
jgi:hypothetical protein